MKITQRIALWGIALAGMAGLTACNNDEAGDLIVAQSVTDSYVYMLNTATGDDCYSTSVSYEIRYNYTNSTGEVNLSNLQMPDGSKYPTMKLSGLKFAIDQDGWRILTGSNIKPSISGFANAPVFDRFELHELDRTINGSYFPALKVAYTIDGVNTAVGSLHDQVLWGTVISTDSEGATFTDTDNQIFVLQFDYEKQTAALTINNAKFSQGMPSMTMTFAGIPYTMSIDGRIVLKATDDIIPTIGGTPYPQFAILNFRGECLLGQSLVVDFGCRPMGQAYTVHANLPYSPKK